MYIKGISKIIQPPLKITLAAVDIPYLGISIPCAKFVVHMFVNIHCPRKKIKRLVVFAAAAVNIAETDLNIGERPLLTALIPYLLKDIKRQFLVFKRRVKVSLTAENISDVGINISHPVLVSHILVDPAGLVMKIKGLFIIPLMTVGIAYICVYTSDA